MQNGFPREALILKSRISRIFTTCFIIIAVFAVLIRTILLYLDKRSIQKQARFGAVYPFFLLFLNSMPEIVLVDVLLIKYFQKNFREPQEAYLMSDHQNM